MLAARREPSVTTRESPLRLVGNREDALGLPFLSRSKTRTDICAMSILPGCLHERAADVSVSGFCDRASPFAVAARVETRDEAQVRGERARRLESLDAVKLGDEDHCGGRVDAAKTSEPRDVFAIQRQLRCFFDLAVYRVQSALRLLDCEPVVGQHDVIDRVFERDRCEPA